MFFVKYSEENGISLFNLLLIGYKAPHRNTVVKQLKRLHQQHFIRTKNEFQEATYLSITCDFWTNRKQNSFLVITGHYIDKYFDQHSKILSFMTFEDRHFSSLIAQEIEKQLISLGLYNKLLTITCDGASNMKDMFTYFTRRNIKYIHCIAHKLHLIICNSLNFWVSKKKKQITMDTEGSAEGGTNEDVEDNGSNTLSQMVRTMSFDIDQSLDNDNNNEDDENNETSKVRYNPPFV
jgi:hypothetical protein